jgi:hypothetical protein
MLKNPRKFAAFLFYGFMFLSFTEDKNIYRFPNQVRSETRSSGRMEVY